MNTAKPWRNWQKSKTLFQTKIRKVVRFHDLPPNLNFKSLPEQAYIAFELGLKSQCIQLRSSFDSDTTYNVNNQTIAH